MRSVRSAGAAHRLPRPGHNALADHRHLLIPSALSGVLTAVVLGMTRAAARPSRSRWSIGNSRRAARGDHPAGDYADVADHAGHGNTVFGEPWQDALWTMSLVLLLMSITSVVLVRVINSRRMAS